MGRVVVVAVALLVAQAIASAPLASSGGEVASDCIAECDEAWSDGEEERYGTLALFQTRGNKVLDMTVEQEAQPQAPLLGGNGRATHARASADAATSFPARVLAEVKASSDSAAPPSSLARQLLGAIAIVGLLLVVALALRACTDRVLNRTLIASSKFGSLTRLKASVLVAALCHFCMSYNAGIIAGAWLYMQESPRLTHIDSVISSLLLGATVGSLGSSTADMVGRKVALLSVAALYVAGAIMMGMASSDLMLVVGRSVAGLGVGMSSVAVNVYISEISPADCRGQLCCWAPVLGTLGVLLSQVVSVVLGSAYPAMAFRLPLALVAAPALAVILSHGLLIESPRWLLLKGRREQATTALAMLFPEAPHDVVATEIQTMENDINVTTATYQPSYMELRNRHGWRVTLGVGINILQQMTGVNVVIYAGPMVLAELGLRHRDALIAAIFVSMVQLCTVILSATLVDRVGRRPVATFGMLGIICSHLVMVIAFAAKSVGDGRWTVVTAAVGMLLFRAAFSFSLGPIPYIMTAELFPAELRATGAAVSMAANWGTNLLVCWSFPVLEEVLASRIGEDVGTSLIFAFYMSFCTVALFSVLRKLPETRARQLERAVEEPSPDTPH
mmetsp:Transcript_105025/g.306884  ORF Transcript_105025/g.306884 Transcript_105025/m.306884 type:complete len:619 (+) Transcript_105025:37-1893(+)